ncbi:MULTISPECIES: hypothetical protein [unclassified Mycoplasma]|uniref:hypothetical protein n=1 Tax=unclassified Mycoplasma TaxID=2683645 RepID=UPI000FDDAB77
MTIKIKQALASQEGDFSPIEVSFASEKLIISPDSDQWNNQGINSFLTKLAANTPSEGKIEVEYDEQNRGEIYLYVVQLFKTFQDQYNSESLTEK